MPLLVNLINIKKIANALGITLSDLFELNKE